MRDDEQKPPKGPYLPPSQPYPSWSYDEEPQPAPPPARPPSGKLPGDNVPNSAYPGPNPNNTYPNPNGPYNPNAPYPGPNNAYPNPNGPYPGPNPNNAYPNPNGPYPGPNPSAPYPGPNPKSVYPNPNITYPSPSPNFNNTAPPRPNGPSGPLYQHENSPISQYPAETYYPDLTMDMGNSLGYSQGLQTHGINMPQPTQGIPRIRQERLQQLREERMRRRQRHMDPTTTAFVPPKGQLIPPGNKGTFSPRAPSGPLGRPGTVQGRTNSAPLPPNIGLQPAIAPAQDTSMIQRVKVARASTIIGGSFMVSSVLGLVQTFLFTYIFGGFSSGDAYLQAYIIPNLIYTVIAGGALSSAFIPIFSLYATQKKDEKTAWHIASSALNISVTAMIVLSIIAMLLSPILVPLYTRREEVGLTITLTRIMLLQAIVLGSGVIIGAILNTKQDFMRTALGAMLYNVGLNLGLLPGFFLAFHSRSSTPSDIAVYAATWGVVLGALLQVGVQIPGLFQVNMHYTFAFDWRHPGVQQIGRQMVPRVLNAMMLSLSTTVDRKLLSLLSNGLINPYIQAFSILLLPVSLFGSSVSTAAFPTLSDYAARGRYERVRSIIMETLRGILFLTIPSGVGLLVLSFPIAQALLEHGNFDLATTQYASTVLFFFALGLPSLAAVEILTRSFYALQDSKTPVTISVIQFILKIALSVLLVNLAVFGIQWGMGALALSTSIAGTFEAIVLFYLLAQRIEGFEMQPFFNFLGHTLLASGAMAIVLLIMRFGLDHLIDTTSMKTLYTLGIFRALAKVFIELGAGTVTFLVVARLLKMEEMNSGLVRRVLNLLKIPWL